MKLVPRPIKYIFIIGASAAILYFAALKMKVIPSFGEWFKAKPVLIDNTPLVITQIKTLALLNTASLYKELVIDSTIIKKADLPTVFYPFTYAPTPVAYKKQLVLIIKGKATASINLRNLPDSNVYVKNDSVSLKLPYPTITDFFINPSDTETFLEEGKWSNEEVTAVKLIARRRLQEEANKQRLLQKAAEKAKSILEQFLTASGFKKITVTFY